MAVFWLGAETAILEEELGPLPCARMRATAASAAIMTMACVLPVGRSGWILASTMYYLCQYTAVELLARCKGCKEKRRDLTKLSVP